VLLVRARLAGVLSGSRSRSGPLGDDGRRNVRVIRRTNTTS
jgi:hypothetical protein